ncbi:MAG: hypothetical protein RML33_06510 [Acidobacteriota bacterium]|nr:hypothetical protein [Pyrinomonadaceae bacterium]MDW8304468.1 hypothetical protein [Acidobacteriota bacterium]
MKICPRCLQTYADDLSFCLSDGIPLIEEQEYKLLSQDQFFLGKEETIQTGRLTSARTSTPTLRLELKKGLTSKWIILVLAVMAFLSIAFLGIWSFNKKQTLSTALPSPQATISLRKASSDTVSQEKMEKIKQEITKVLLQWANTNSNKDLEAHLANYADVLEVYYSESNRDKNHVRADRLRAYRKYDSILIQIENIEIFVDSEDTATALFDKSWTMKGPEKISTGAVQQEMKFTKSGGNWLINGERDVKVYYINNRDVKSDREPVNSTTSITF